VSSLVAVGAASSGAFIRVGGLTIPWEPIIAALAHIF
jgi:hypothetical protein